jgi:D-alanyl-lipoteichoic acid acyltransferase DltB (MBOAT superfamily)
MANVFMVYYLRSFPMYSPKIRLIGMVSFFGCIINNLLAFVMILQPEPKRKIIKGLVVFIVLANYLFFSYYIFPLTGILIAFFGPAEQAIETTILAVEVIGYILQLLIMISQMILIRLLGTEEDYYDKAKLK